MHALLQMFAFVVLNALSYILSYHILLDSADRRGSVLVYGSLQSLLGFAVGYFSARCGPKGEAQPLV